MLKLDNSFLLLVDIQGKLASMMYKRKELIESLTKLIQGIRILELPIPLEELNPKSRPRARVAELLYERFLAQLEPDIVLISSIFDEGYLGESIASVGKFTSSYLTAAIHYDLIAITITDPRELELPNAGLVGLADAETGERILVDTASATARKRFNIAARARHLEIKESLSRLNIDQIDIHTDRDYVRDLIRFFQSRERRQTL